MNEEKIEDITQSPLEIGLKGKSYKLGAIGFIDFGDFAQYIKGQKIELTEHIKDRELKLQIIEKIMNEPIALEKEYGTINGVSYMAWKAIQKYQPEITLKDMNNLIDMDNFEQVSIILNNLGGKIENPTKKAKANR
uniref:Uncharacterized protein n=1 Tax=viral metagenome TaxID=1070528 RepID=A0A6M3LSF3_9ZZZZ